MTVTFQRGRVVDPFSVWIVTADRQNNKRNKGQKFTLTFPALSSSSFLSSNSKATVMRCCLCSSHRVGLKLSLSDWKSMESKVLMLFFSFRYTMYLIKFNILCKKRQKAPPINTINTFKRIGKRYWGRGRRGREGQEVEHSSRCVLCLLYFTVSHEGWEVS